MRIQDINTLADAGVRENLQRAYTQKTTFFEFRHRLASGEIREVDVFSSPIESQEGMLLHSVIVDVTNRRQAEHRYRSLFEQSNDGVFILDVEGRHLQANQRAADMLGYDMAEMMQLTYRDMVVAEEQHASDSVLQRMLAGEVVPPYERTFRRKDGSQILTEVNVEIVHGKDGTPLYIQSILRDITERKRMEQTLREREKRLKMTLDGTRSGTWEWNIHTGETVLNERWAEIIGYTLDELLPVNIHTWLDNTHPDDLQESLRLLEKHFTGELDYYACEMRMKHKDGHWVWVMDRGMVMEWDADGQPLRMFGTHMDITERRQAQQQEIELTLERERLSILKNFIGNATHEFKTPLTTISSSAYLMAHADDKDRRIQKMKHIEGQIRQVTGLVDMLMLVAKLESGDPFSRNAVDIQEILALICHKMPQKYQNRELHCESQSDLPRVMGNISYLLDAFYQLMDNAFRFTPPGGAITLKTYLLHQQVCVEITDTGPGIPPEALPHIFEMFWRQDLAHTTPGFGLGLSIARKIIELHQGSITVESEVGEGASFLVKLPAFS